MAFSFVSAFLESFLPSKKQGPGLTEYLRELPEPVPGEVSALGMEEPSLEDAWLLSDEERRERENTIEREQDRQNLSAEELFLRYDEWLFASRSHHVNAMRYDAEQERLVVQYDRGDTWSYDPINLALARKFALDLLGGSPGTDVWDYLRQRGTQHDHMPGINAVQLSGPGPEPHRRPRRETSI